MNKKIVFHKDVAADPCGKEFELPDISTPINVEPKQLAFLTIPTA
jgi:hypothetical protein